MRAKILPAMDRRGTSVIVTRLAVAFPFVDVDYAGIFDLLWDLPFFPHRLERLCQFLHHGRATCFVHFTRDYVWSWRFTI